MKEKPKYKEVKKVFDTHIYQCDGLERPRSVRIIGLCLATDSWLNFSSIWHLQVLWVQLRAVKWKDQETATCWMPIIPLPGLKGARLLAGEQSPCLVGRIGKLLKDPSAQE